MRDDDEEPKVIISQKAAMAAIGALGILEREVGVSAEIKAAMGEIIDALMRSGRNPS